MNRLSDSFFRYAEETPDATALWVDGVEWPYGEMAAWGRWHKTDRASLVPVVDVGAYAHAAILGALWHGYPYVPYRVGQGMAPSVHGHPDGLAYIMFTSGSTGEPKGVPITHENALAYVEHTADRMGVTSDDRFTQMHDLTFDFSVHDIWVPWSRGASVYVVPKAERFAPTDFINRHEITCFAAVPSVLASMDRLGLLTPDSLPTLRRTVFCGEALPARLCEKFQAAAPNCVVENIYGPTEATVAITSYEWHEGSMAECRRGIVPLGKAFPGHQAYVDTVGGEIGLMGAQVFSGYWGEPSCQSGMYFTGDLGEYDENGNLHFVGRLDNQIQVRGHRVELGEIEAVFREAGCEVVCVGWPIEDGIVTGVVAFADRSMPEASAVYESLPDYKQPWRVIISEFPKNANGKVDRKALLKMLEGGA